MNINDFKQHLHAVHNTLDDPSLNKQMKDRLKESPVCDMKEYKPNVMKDKSTHKPTTGAGDTLRPNSKTAEPIHKLKEEIEIPEIVEDYFNAYFGDNLTEDTSEEDITEAVDALVELCADVCDAVGLEEAFARQSNYVQKRATGPGSGLTNMTIPIKDPPADKSGYLKPSPEQLRTAIAKKADNSPLLQTGQGTNTKTVRPSDIQAEKRAKRIKRMAKFGK